MEKDGVDMQDAAFQCIEDNEEARENNGFFGFRKVLLARYGYLKAFKAKSSTVKEPSNTDIAEVLKKVHYRLFQGVISITLPPPPLPHMPPRSKNMERWQAVAKVNKFSFREFPVLKSNFRKLSFGEFAIGMLVSGFKFWGTWKSARGEQCLGEPGGVRCGPCAFNIKSTNPSRKA